MSLLRDVTLNRSSRKADKSVSMTFTTSLEESSEGFMEIDKLINQSGLIYFKPKGNITDEELKELDNFDVKVEGKTQSQRLRNVLYILHQQSNAPTDFKEFYKNETEKIIQHYKDKLI